MRAKDRIGIAKEKPYGRRGDIYPLSNQRSRATTAGREAVTRPSSRPQRSQILRLVRFVMKVGQGG